MSGNFSDPRITKMISIDPRSVGLDLQLHVCSWFVTSFVTNCSPTLFFYFHSQPFCSGKSKPVTATAAPSAVIEDRSPANISSSSQPKHLCSQIFMLAFIFKYDHILTSSVAIVSPPLTLHLSIIY